MPVNITSINTSSNGVWQGDNPLQYAFPLLIVQITLVLAISRILAFLLKPLRQPKVIAEVVGGIILGPSGLGRNQEYMHKVFPKWSMPILESVASIGLIFFLFLVGLELDLSSIRRSGRKAFGIAAAGISLPFIFGLGMAFVLRKTIEGADKVGFGQFVVFMGVAFSVTAFPVLARILAELKLLTTSVGETAMAAAAFNDLVAWILLALAIALASDDSNGHYKSPLISVWILLSGVAFVAFMMLVIRPAMNWLALRCSPELDTVNEAYMCLTLAGVLVSGFMTDLIGIHAIFGAFVFGLTIPKGRQFDEKLTERIEDFVSGLLLPLYFASSGLKTDVAKIQGAEAWGLLVLVITTACAGKIIGTFALSMACKIPCRESVALGVLMNTKGLVELIVLNIGKEKKVLNDEVFAILVLMALFTIFITTPTVMAIYKPARPASAKGHSHRKLQSYTRGSTDELRILACVHGPGNVPSLITLIESTRSTSKSRLKLYVMHLVELTERSSSIVMIRRLRKNGFPFINRFRGGELHDRVAAAFQAFGQLGRVSVRPATAISAFPSMHEDICHVAEDKGVSLIILPFHKLWRKMDGEDEMEDVRQSWRAVNQRVLQEAPCSVAVLVDRGFGRVGQELVGVTCTMRKRVCVIFFGGPDDREALVLGSKMAEHPAVKVALTRFIGKESLGEKRDKEKEQDEEAVAEFRRKWEGKVDYVEMAMSKIVEGLLTTAKSGEFDLILVGKGPCPTTPISVAMAELLDRQAEHPELGPIGDILASSGLGILSSALVIQQQNNISCSDKNVVTAP